MIVYGGSCLCSTGITNVEELAAQREDAILITANDTEAADGQSFGRVSLSEDQSALLRAAAPGIVCIVQLGNACMNIAFCALTSSNVVMYGGC
jgi:hypothetical protein